MFSYEFWYGPWPYWDRVIIQPSDATDYLKVLGPIAGALAGTLVGWAIATFGGRRKENKRISRLRNLLLTFIRVDVIPKLKNEAKWYRKSACSLRQDVESDSNFATISTINFKHYQAIARTDLFTILGPSGGKDDSKGIIRFFQMTAALDALVKRRKVDKKDQKMILARINRSREKADKCKEELSAILASLRHVPGPLSDERALFAGVDALPKGSDDLLKFNREFVLPARALLSQSIPQLNPGGVTRDMLLGLLELLDRLWAHIESVKKGRSRYAEKWDKMAKFYDSAASTLEKYIPKCEAVDKIVVEMKALTAASMPPTTPSSNTPTNQ